MREIERKFLVNDSSYKQEAYGSVSIKQGYLNSHPERTVRVRVQDGQGYLTIKGKSSEDGVSRFEWEQVIPRDEADALFDLCEQGIIEKTRFLIKSGPHIIEVDEFYGENLGLVVAEIELEEVNELYQKPHWLGEEVTGRNQYYNAQLKQNPFKNWKN